MIVHFTNLRFLPESHMDIWTIDTELAEAVVGPCCLPKSVSCRIFPKFKAVLFLTEQGLTKSYKGLIFISEKAWASC